MGTVAEAEIGKSELVIPKTFWRKEEPVLNEKRMVIKGGMFKHQRDWWEAPNFFKALVTGYGGGKTFIGAKRAIALALENAPCPHICVSPSYKISRKTLIPAIRLLLDGKMDLEPTLSYRYHKTDFEFTILCKGRKATIWMLSGDDPDSLKGSNAGSALIDEPFIMKRDVLDQIVARVRHPDAGRREIGMTGTPEELNWGYEICEGEDKVNYDMALFQASSHANKALPKGYVERMERTFDSKAAEAFVGGKFVSLSKGLVYYGFSDKNIVNLQDPGSDLHFGLDFNVNPMAAAVFCTSGNHIHFIDEIELENSDTQDMCIVLREKYKERLKMCFPDATGKSRRTNAPGGKSDFHYIKEAGYENRSHSTNPARRDRFNATNGKLDPKKGNPTMTVAPNCKKLIRYFKDYSFEKMTKQKDMSHLTDAATYPVAYLFPVRLALVLKHVQGA